MSHALRWWREKGVLRTHVSPFGFYEVRRHDRKSFRAFLNREGTQYYGSEEDCMRAIQRVVNSMVQQKEEQEHKRGKRA